MRKMGGFHYNPEEKEFIPKLLWFLEKNVFLL